MITTYQAWDTLFFRDGKPFSLGEDTWASSIFPPLPSTVYGALRTGYLAMSSASPDNIEELTKDFFIRGIYLKKDETFLFPAPADTHLEKDGGDIAHISYDLGAIPANGAISSSQLQVIKQLDRGQRPARGVFFTEAHIQDYLKDIAENFLRIVEEENLIAYENKIGIGRDDATRSVQESRLYRVQMQRWGSLKLVVDSNLESLSILPPNQLRLGGEGKAVRLTSEKDIPDIPIPSAPAPYFRLYFASPALFNNGWLPEGLKKKNGLVSGTWRNVQLELLAAFVGKPLRIGGFDVKERVPKPMRQAVPAGSVYYFRAPEANGQDIIDNFHEQALSDLMPEQGYGLAYVGPLNPSHFKNLKNHV